MTLSGALAPQDAMKEGGDGVLDGLVPPTGGETLPQPASKTATHPTAARLMPIVRPVNQNGKLVTQTIC